MKFGYTIIFVSNLEATLAFYEKAFGFKTKFLAESKLYGELDTGSSTTLSFCMEKHVETQGIPFVKNHPKNLSAGIEIAFITEDVSTAFQKAVDSGATPIKGPTKTHWGQTVAYVRDLNGVLVELCSPIGITK